MMDKILPKFLQGREDSPGLASYVPSDRTVMIPPPVVQRRRLSEAAAHAAQQWEDLENERNTFKLGLDSANAHISVLEESNTIIKEELDRMQSQMEYYQRRCIRLLTFIEQIGHLTIGAAKDTEPEVIRDAINSANGDTNETSSKHNQNPPSSTVAATLGPEGGQTTRDDRRDPAG